MIGFSKITLFGAEQPSYLPGAPGYDAQHARCSSLIQDSASQQTLQFRGFGRCYALSEACQLLLGPHTAHTTSKKKQKALEFLHRKQQESNESSKASTIHAQKQEALRVGTQGRHMESQWHCTSLGGGQTEGPPPPHPKHIPPRSECMHGCCWDRSRAQSSLTSPCKANGSRANQQRPIRASY